MGGNDDVGDGLSVVGGGVVGGNVEHVGVIAGGLDHRGQVVHVGKGVLGAGVVHPLQVALNGLHLEHGVGLGGAVDQTHVFGVGEELLEHRRLLVQGGQVGGAGDVPAQHLVLGGVQVQGHTVVGDGGAQDGNGVGGRGGGGEGGGGVGQNQVHSLGDKAVNDGGAAGGLAAGIALPEGNGVPQGLGQGVLKALGGGVQRGVGGQLADTHHIAAAGRTAGRVRGSGIGRGGRGLTASAAGAGGQGQGQRQCKKQCG